MEKKKKELKRNSFILLPNTRKKEKSQNDYVGYGVDEHGRRFRLDGWKLEMKGKHKGKAFVAGNLNYLSEEFQLPSFILIENDKTKTKDGLDINDF